MSQSLRAWNEDWVVETSEIHLSGESMILADPCYDEEIMDLRQRSNQDALIVGRLGTCFNRIKPGNYSFRLKRNDGSCNGRVAGWIMYHERVSTYAQKIALDVPVDSGQVGFFKAADAYQLTETDFLDQPFYLAFKTLKQEWSNGNPNYTGHHDWYMYMCATSLADTDDEVEFNASGICTGSGYGDGCYEAFAYLNESDELVALEIEFIENVGPCCDNCGEPEEFCTCSDDEEDEDDTTDYCWECGNSEEDCVCDCDCD